MDKLKFALIGAAGFVAPRHMKAIKDVGGELVAALDPHDSVGILDKYFPQCHFFTEFERFDRHLCRYPVDYVSICSPNYLHDAHCRAALRWGADAICEKPLCVNPALVDELQEEEERYSKRIWNIMQCRLHPAVRGGIHGFKGLENVLLYYSAPRGRWYDHSWKSNQEKSGGLVYNIGVHLFDIVSLLWGNLREIESVAKFQHSIDGRILLDAARVEFTLSIDWVTKPTRRIVYGDPNYVHKKMNEIDLSGGFEDLHTLSYQEILAGRGFGVEGIREAIKICHKITSYTKAQ